MHTVKTALILGLIAALLEFLPSCAPFPTAEPSPSSTPLTSEGVARPTQSPTLYPTKALAPTPTAQLPTTGPFLLYTRYLGRDTSFIIVGPDGIGRSQLRIPEGAQISYLPGSISSDGSWIAYYTGSDTGDYDLALNVARVFDGTTLPPIPLISESHVQDLAQIATALPTERPGFYSEYPPDTDWTGPIEMTFRTGIFSHAWSPVKNELAFVAQIDGPSSDVYLFDVESQSIRRLTADTFNSGYLAWSPDGEWVLYENLVPDGVYDYNGPLYAVRATRPSRYPPPLESSFWWSDRGWLSDKLLLLTGQGDTGGPYDLRSVDIKTGKTQDLWPDVYEDMAIDPRNALIALSAAPSAYDFAIPATHLEDGLYFVALDGRRRKVSDSVFWSLVYLGPGSPQFIGLDGKDIVAISEDGSTKVIESLQPGQISPSPDGMWFVVFGENGMDVVSHSDLSTLVHFKDPVSAVSWRPDSAAFFFLSEGALSLMSVPAGHDVLVDDCAAAGCQIGSRYSTWLP
jgi:hypothetical protein